MGAAEGACPGEPAGGSARLDAFVSYRRLPADTAFVDRLQQALAARGKQVWVDRSRIEAAADWSERIARGITSARALIFVITPESVSSVECRRELEAASEHHKLVVPVVLRDVDPADLPEALTKPNWTFFTDGHDFDESLVRVVDALEGDLEWRDEHTRLAVRSGEWSTAKRDRSFLLRGTDLRVAEQWLAEAPRHDKTPPTVLQTEYVLASRRAADRSQRTWRAALSAGLAVALALAALAFVQRNQAQHERNVAQVNARLAQSRALAAEATAALSTDPQQSLSEALASTRIVASDTAEQSLRLALAAAHQRMVIRSGLGAATQATWNPQQNQVAITSAGHAIELWNAETGRLVQTLPLRWSATVTQLIYDASGSRLAAVAADGDVSVWDTPPGAPARALSTSSLTSQIRATAFSEFHGDLYLSAVWAEPSGNQLDVFGAGLSNVLLFDPVLDETEHLFAGSLSSGAQVVTPSPDGSDLLVDGDLIDFRTRQQSELPDVNGEFTDSGPACWMPDGSAVATWTTVDAGGPIDLWSATTHKMVGTMQLPIGPTTAVACSAGTANSWLAGGDTGGNLRLRLTDGSVVPLYGQSDAISAIASSPDGRELATSSLDGTARIWDAATGREIAVLAGGAAPLQDVQFGPAGGLVLTVDTLGFVRIWDADLGQPVTELQRPAGGTAVALGFIKAGAEAVGLEVEQSRGSAAAVTSAWVLTWDASTGRLERRLALPGLAAATIPCSPRLASVGQDARLGAVSGSCNIPPPSSLTLGVPVTRHDRFGSFQVLEPLAVAVNPDGREVAYATPHAIAVIDDDGHHIARLALRGSPTGLAFAGPIGQLLVMTTSAIYLWSPMTKRVARTIAQPSAPIDAELSASGARLAVASVSGLVEVFDVASGKRLIAIGSPSKVTPGSYFPPAPLRVALDPSGRVVASGNEDGTVSFFDVATTRRIAVRTVSAWPIIELDTAAGGSRLLAVVWPAAGTGANPAGAAAVLDTSTGGLLATYQSPPPTIAPIDPGASLSPDGAYLFAGTLGLSPSPPGGVAATYQVATGQTMANLQASADSVVDSYSFVPPDPWSPDGSEVLTGDAIYACDACGNLGELQRAAASRLAWAKPLTAARDHPPSEDPYR